VLPPSHPVFTVWCVRLGVCVAFVAKRHYSPLAGKLMSVVNSCYLIAKLYTTAAPLVAMVTSTGITV
jgi:hypothetical protein